MNLGLEESVAIIFGGANGIGLAISRAFAEEGAHVAIADISPEVANRAGELARDFNDRVTGHICSVTDATAVNELSRQVQAKYGRVDHVVIAAGLGSGKLGFPFLNVPPEDWKRIYDVNVQGAVHVAHAFAPHMMERRQGSFLFLASVAGQIGSQTDPPYSAFKAAIINFMHCVAKDLAPHHVRANAISPGMVQTNLNRAVWQSWNDRQPADKRLTYAEWGEGKVRAMCPLGDWQSPEEIASVAVFLASNKARNITGQTINVDGGWVMHS